METAETLRDKLDLFIDLKDGEREKIIEKFLADFVFIDYKELENALVYLRSQNVCITLAREVKVLVEENFIKKFDILNEVKATDIYSYNPEYLMLDALDLFKKIKYCLQQGKDYKNPDGTYKDFLFDRKLWSEEFSNKKETNLDTVGFNDLPMGNEEVEVKIPDINIDEKTLNDAEQEHQDIKEYIDSEKNSEQIEPETTSFEEIEEGLKKLKAQLEKIDNSVISDFENNENVFHFNDIEGETYNVGRGRAA